MPHVNLTRDPNAVTGGVSVQRRWVDEKALSHYSGIAVRTLQRWRLFNQGPAFKKFGGAVRYDLTAFDAWAAAQEGGGDTA